MTLSVRTKWVAGIVVIVVVMGAAIGVLYRLADAFLGESFFPEHKVVAQNVSLNQAKKECPIPLPSGAKNISYGLWSCGIGYGYYVRFEAPSATCLAHIPVVLGASSLKGNVASGPSPATNRITSPLEPVSFPELDLSWFDVHNIRNGVMTDTGGSQQPTIWVDTDRGVFYYRKTD